MRAYFHSGAWIIAATLSLAAGCAGSQKRAAEAPRAVAALQGPSEELAVAKTFFVPNERMAWEMTLMGVRGGESQLVVGQPGIVDGHSAIMVRSESKSAGVLDKIKHVSDIDTTTLALDTTTPLNSTAELEFGNKSINTRAAFHRGGYHVVAGTRGGPETHQHGSLPDGVLLHNLHSALGVLRAWEPDSGERAHFYAINGKRLFRVEITATREAIRTRLGTFPAVRIQGVAYRLEANLEPKPGKTPRTFRLWLSDDANRIPLRIYAATNYGKVKIEMTGYDRPDRGAATAAAR